jgi:hypothetical protein
VTRIALTRSGGFAGITKRVDVADLPPATAREIEELAANVAAEPDLVPAHPDEFIYRLTLGEREYTLPEHAVPAELKPLVDRLKTELR